MSSPAPIAAGSSSESFQKSRAPLAIKLMSLDPLTAEDMPIEATLAEISMRLDLGTAPSKALSAGDFTLDQLKNAAGLLASSICTNPPHLVLPFLVAYHMPIIYEMITIRLKRDLGTDLLQRPNTAYCHLTEATGRTRPMMKAYVGGGRRLQIIGAFLGGEEYAQHFCFIHGTFVISDMRKVFYSNSVFKEFMAILEPKKAAYLAAVKKAYSAPPRYFSTGELVARLSSSNGAPSFVPPPPPAVIQAAGSQDDKMWEISEDEDDSGKKHDTVKDEPEGVIDNESFKRVYDSLSPKIGTSKEMWKMFWRIQKVAEDFGTPSFLDDPTNS